MIANVHDIVLTIGFMSISQVDFDLTSIAALLTILGYSLNDTVVIYDRIREMLRRYKKMPMPQLLNESINSTLSRSIITHVTVTLALLALLLFGGHAIHSFTAVMMFGVVLVGTYTSIFIAAPILIYLGVGEHRDAPEKPAKRSKRWSCSSDVPHFPRSAPIEAYGKGGFAFADMSHRGSLLCLPDGIWAWAVTKPERNRRVFAGARLQVGQCDRHAGRRHRHRRLDAAANICARRCARCGWCWTRCRRGRRSAPTTS